MEINKISQRKARKRYSRKNVGGTVDVSEHFGQSFFFVANLSSGMLFPWRWARHFAMSARDPWSGMRAGACKIPSSQSSRRLQRVFSAAPPIVVKRMRLKWSAFGGGFGRGSMPQREYQPNPGSGVVCFLPNFFD